MSWVIPEKYIVIYKGLWFLEMKELLFKSHHLASKDFRGSYVRRMTATTAAITLAFLFVEMLCYVLERLHSS